MGKFTGGMFELINTQILLEFERNGRHINLFDKIIKYKEK